MQVPIDVVRIICWSSFHRKKRPYTITILPEFCFPFGQRKIDDLLPILGRLAEGRGSIEDAALRIGDDCNVKTVYLYYRRFRDRIQKWNLTLLAYFLNVLHGFYDENNKPTSIKNDTRKNWESFLMISKQIIKREEALPQFILRDQHVGYFMAIIQQNNPALGP